MWLDREGIDPSLFFDADGQVNYTRQVDGERGYSGQQLLNLQTGKLEGQIKELWRGTGGGWPAGPQQHKQLFVSAGRHVLAPAAVKYRGIFINDEAPQIITVVPKGYTAGDGNRDWEKSVTDNVRPVKSKHPIATSGAHTFKVWMVDPAVVVQKIVVDFGGVKPSYLGPPESHRAGK